MHSINTYNSATLCLALFTVLQQYTQPTNAQAQQDSVCSLCFGGEEANLTATVGGAADGVPCSALVNDLLVDEETCRDLQLLGFRYCGCPSYPTDHFCPMCEDSFIDIPVRFQAIPGTPDTCDDRLFVPLEDVDGDCTLAMKPGFACGCPNAEEPACQICGGQSNDITNLSLDGILVQTIGSFTCQEWADQAVLGDLDTEQCALVTDAVADICCPPVEEEEEVVLDTGSDMGDEEESLVAESDSESVNATSPPEEVTTEAPKNNDNSAAAAPDNGSLFWMAMVVTISMSVALL